MTLYLYKITRDVIDTDVVGAVVVAATDDEARLIHPEGRNFIWDGERNWWSFGGQHFPTYWPAPSQVTVELIGVAAAGLAPRTIILTTWGEPEPLDTEDGC